MTYDVDADYIQMADKKKTNCLGRITMVNNTHMYMTANQFGEQHNADPRFLRPELYFRATETSLGILGTDFVLRMDRPLSKKAVEAAQKILGTRWTREDIMGVHAYLQTKTFSTYYQTLLKFKWDNSLLVFPLFDRSENIRQVDGILFGCFSSPWMPNEPRAIRHWEPLTQFNVAAEIKKYTLAPKASTGKSSDGFPEDKPEDEPEDEPETEPDDEPDDEINDKSGNGAEKKSSNGAGREKDDYALTDRSSDKTKEALAKELKKLHANELSFDYEGANVLRAEYSDGYLEYSLPLERARFCRREYIFPGKFVQSGIKRAGTGPQRPSEELKEQLRILTSGSAERLDTLAELFARLFFRSLPSKYLWRITGPGGRGFSVWLCNLAENKVDDVLFQPNNPDWKYRLIWDYYFNTMIQSSGNFMVSANMKYMKKKTLLQGILGEMPDISECFQPDMPTRYAPLVLWADAIYTKTPDDAFGSIPLREIYVPENICIAKLAPSDELWLKVCFAAYGARIINKKDEEMRISIDDVIANFVSEYCVKNSEADLGCKEFYNALCSYVCVLPFHVELEKGSTNLSAKMESKFGWKKQTNRKKGNIMTFSGIQLDTVKLQKAIEMLKIKRAEEEYPRTKFEKRIARITDAVEWTI